jgi:hypothetical protein
MKSIGISDSYQNGNLKIIIYFARFLGSATDFLSIMKKEQILSFLDTRIKNTEIDPEKRWIRTWNDYLQRIKYFFRRLYNKREQEIKGIEVAPQSDWITPLIHTNNREEDQTYKPLFRERAMGAR